jgi:glycosyltransferase involved in cell wall biosynthesis
MRVLLDYRPALRARTGVGEWTHQLSVSLLRLKSAGDSLARDLDLTLWTSSWRDRPEPGALAELAGATVIDRRIPVRPLTWAWNRLRRPSVEALASRHFDIVHSTAPLLLPSRAGVRVCTIYDLDFLHHPERVRGEMRRDFPRLVRDHAAKADLVATISEHSRRQIQDALGVASDRIVVCRPGVPAWVAKVAVQPDGRSVGHILFVGTLEPRKNIQGLLAAYRILVERNPGTPRLVLAGRVTPDARPWIDAARSSPLGGRVEIAGYVPDDERNALYSGARLLVLPSFEEGFGLPVLEAMALGVPVVASDRGALPEVLGGAGLLVDPSDPGGLALAMERVLVDPQLAGRMRADGLRRSGDFDWLASARVLLGAYGSATERAHSGVAPARGSRP